jgi:hypothetical protein
MNISRYGYKYQVSLQVPFFDGDDDAYAILTAQTIPLHVKLLTEGV